MTFDWHGYFLLGRDLGGVGTDPPGTEAKLRSAISRFYYSALCKARNFLRDVDGDCDIPRDVDVHDYVCSEFESSADTNRRKIGAKLKRLRHTRNQVDYDDDLPFDLAKMFSEKLREAEDCSRTLDYLASGSGTAPPGSAR